jgi:hypothetical protein
MTTTKAITHDGVTYDDFGEIAPQPVKVKKPDALAKAMKGSIPVEDNPLSSQWREAGEVEARRIVMQQLARDEVINLANGEWVTTDRFRRAMDRKAFDMVQQGATVDDVTHHCFMNEAQVRAIAARHGLQGYEDAQADRVVAMLHSGYLPATIAKNLDMTLSSVLSIARRNGVELS